LFDGDAVTLAKKGEIDINFGFLNDSITGKLVDGSGNEGQKILLRDKATKTLGNKARGCAPYFHDHDLLDIEAILNHTKTYYDDYKQEEIVGILKGVRKVLFDNEGVLGPYHVDAPWFVIVDGQIQDLQDVIPVIGDAHEASGAANVNVDKYISLVDKGYDQLDGIVINAFDEGHHDEVEAFLATRGQDTIGRHHNNVACSMKLSPAMTGIDHGLIVFTDPATGLVIKSIHVDAFGLGNVIMKLGEYYATASAPGCVTQQKLFRPLYRDTLHLDFVMLPA
jgi:hypothetical protein